MGVSFSVAVVRIEPPTMNTALSVLTAPITRARRSSPDQACTAAKIGTTNSPAAQE